AMTLSIVGSGDEQVNSQQMARSLDILDERSNQPGKGMFPRRNGSAGHCHGMGRTGRPSRFFVWNSRLTILQGGLRRRFVAGSDATRHASAGSACNGEGWKTL